MSRVKSLKKIEEGIKMIDAGIDLLEKYDIYGDLAENFCEMNKTTRITTELRATICCLETNNKRSRRNR